MSTGLMIAIVALLAVSPLLARAGVALIRRRRTPLDLRGDWWSSFEAEFRAYARRQSRHGPRHHGAAWGHGERGPRAPRQRDVPRDDRHGGSWTG